MSRCYCCDCKLTDQEASKVSNTTGQYLDMCSLCYKEVDYAFIDPEELTETPLQLNKKTHK